MSLVQFPKLFSVAPWCVLLLLFQNVNSEFNSSQQYNLPSPAVRNLDVPHSGSSSYNFGSRIASGGKYRSSFYQPKAIKNFAPSPGGPKPTWVVWGRQGTPFEENKYYGPSDFQQYTVANVPSGPSVDELGNNYLYGNDLMNPYQEELASYPSGWSWTRADTEGSEELDENDIDMMTASQLQGFVKTRRTGIGSLGGLLSLKGLKLSAIGFFYLFRGVVMLAWKFLPWIFLISLGFMFLPIPIITIPAAAGRSSALLNVNMTEVTNAVSGLVSQLEQSEQCVERMACELRRGIRESWVQPPLKLFIYNYQSKLPSGLQRMAKAYLERKKCKHYRCFVYSDSMT